MSEPDTGSDLASVRTRAERAGAGWRLNGTKLWTTHGHRAHYMIALVRTHGGVADRTEGLSQVLVDLSLPGVTTRPIADLAGDESFCEVHFHDVELAADALLGQAGKGWAQVNAELAFERSGPERIYSSAVLVDGWMAYVRNRGRPTDAERRLAGEWVAELAVLRRLSISVTAQIAAGEAPVMAASVVKDLGTSFEQSIPGRIADHLAGEPATSLPADLVATLDYVAAMAPSFSIRGGTREVTVSAAAHAVHGAIGISQAYGLHQHVARLRAWSFSLGSRASQATALGAWIMSSGEDLTSLAAYL